MRAEVRFALAPALPFCCASLEEPKNAKKYKTVIYLAR